MQELPSTVDRPLRGGREKADAMMVLARENGFSAAEALASVLMGYDAEHEKTIDEAIKAMLRGMETMRAAGEITGF